MFGTESNKPQEEIGFDPSEISLPDSPQSNDNPNELPSEIVKEVMGDHEPFYRTYMKNVIKSVEEYSWSRGEVGGLSWGFDNLDKAFEGLNTGVHLVGGVSNIGRK